MSLPKFFTPIFVVFFLFVSSNAQIQDSSINITVKNQLSEIIPEAEILLFKDGKQIKTLKPNKQGFVRFTNLAAGNYQISITAKGFNNFKSEVISLRSGETKSLEAALEVSPIESNVTVGGDDDVENSGTTKVLDENQIQRLPDDPQQLERILRSIAGESATGEEMPITVDGQQGAKLPPKDQIQAIRINQNVFSAQYEGPNAWGIEIFTRSNVDKFSGSVWLNYKDSRLNAADPFIGRRIPNQYHNLSFNLSGPITKKSMFAVWLQQSRNKSSRAVNATILDSQFRPVAFQSTFSNPNNGIYGGLTFAAELNKKNKFSANYNFSDNNSKGGNVEGFSLPSRANDNEFQAHNLRFSETFFASENLINQFRGSVSYQFNRDFGGSNEVAINVLEAFFGGGSQNNSSRKRLNFEIANDTSWQKNKYSVNFGWQLRGLFINQTSTSNYGGTYTFSGRIAPVLDANNNPVLDSNGNFVTTQISSLETYRRTLLFRQSGFSASQIRTLGGGASQFTISGGNPTVSAKHADIAGYIQNTYKLKENVAVSFGIRYENQRNIESNFDISPRLGLIWSPKNNPKKSSLLALPKLSFGYGMFYSRYNAFNFLSIKQATGADRATYLITDAGILDLFPAVSSVSQLQQFALPKTQRFISPELQTPRMQMFSLTANKKLPAGFSANISLSHSKSERQSVSRNINAAFNGIRPLGNVGNVYQTNSIGQSERTRFAVTLNLPDKIMWGNIRYDFTKAQNDLVSGSGLPINPFDFSQEYAPTSADGVHSISSYFDYKLPFGFSFSGNFSYQTGSRFNITTGKDTNGDGYFLERPAFATDLTKPNLIRTEYGVLDPNPSPNDKIIPRNLGRGTSNLSFDAYLSKSIGFGGDKANKKPPKQTLNFSLSVDNVFNVVNRSNPIGNMSSPNFLKVLSGTSGNFVEGADGIFYGTGSNSPRAFSFSMSFRF